MEISGIPMTEFAEKYGTPLYIYDFDRIRENARRLKRAFQADDTDVIIYYSVKANNHPEIVKILLEEGYGIDCASPGELALALKCGADPGKILYSSNYESVAELKFAYDSGVIINLDDINSLARLLKSGTPDLISFRINPGEGHGQYEQITTGGYRAKFGIPFQKAVTAYQTAIDAGIRRFGAHMMTGSGVLDAEWFPSMLELFLFILKEIKTELGITFEFVDMGGGFGIPYFGDDEALDVVSVGNGVLNVFKKRVAEFDLGEPALALEPGRFLVGDAGVLLSRVIGIKKSYRTFVGLDAGFNTLIRPALYGAQHPIIIHGKEAEELTMKADICGQICENTDIFAKNWLLPDVTEGDLLVFTQAGAYGNVMSNSYNLRFRPAEVAVMGGQHKLITRRATITDFLSRIQTI